MSVRKSLARLIAADGSVIGEGRAYLHLPRPVGEAQSVQGTLSLDWWDDAASTTNAELELADGPRLRLSVDSDRLGGCVQGRILRYQTTWPGLTTS